MKDLRISMVQTPSFAGDLDGNLDRMLSFVNEAKGSDIVCFPELSLTGYKLPDSALHAVRRNDDIVARVSAAAAERGTAIAFGFAEKDDHGTYISHALADTDGTLSIYRKTHLGKFEKEHFTPGNEFKVTDTGKVRIGFQMCIESHFPEITTCLAYRGAELILMPFATPMDIDHRMDTWKKYLPARAYDNGVFVAACNYVKEERGGGAIIIDPRGNIVAEDRAGKGSMLTAVLKGDMAKRVHIEDRTNMRDTDFFGSRRPELYFDVTLPLRDMK
ncbi:MAG: hypothetical protein LBH69_02540 [Methanomassiliicoccaceae archaeon]|jgi:predicted amidohydrolase|nr:hypothetical protein [Methanomassiliicoccaceae archaeon]